MRHLAAKLIKCKNSTNNIMILRDLMQCHAGRQALGLTELQCGGDVGHNILFWEGTEMRYLSAV